MFQITIDNKIRLQLPLDAKERWPGLMKQLRKDMVLDNPAYQEALKYSRSTRGIPARIVLWELDRNTGILSLPRGYIRQLLEFLNQYGFFYRLDDHRVTLPPVEFNSKISLRDYQKSAVEALFETNQGILQAPAGSGKCLEENSLIFTDKGLMRLNELLQHNLPDQFIYNHFQVDTGFATEIANGIYDGGYSKTILARLRFGYEIEGTPEHPILTFNGRYQWKSLRDLNIGDYVVIKRGSSTWGQTIMPFVFKPRKGTSNIIQLGSLELNEDSARAIGLIVAEGYFGYRTSLQFSNKDEENLEIIRKWMNSLGLKVVKKSGNNYDYYICSVQLRDYLKFIGVSNGLSHQQVVPSGIRMGGREISRAFLQGFIEGEGNINSNYIEVSSASKNLLKEVQIMLLGFGILSSLTSKYNKKMNKTYYRLFIYEIDRFSREINFITKRKRISLQSLLIKRSHIRNPNVCLVPYIKKTIQIIYEAARKSSGWKHTDGRLFGDYVSINRNRNPSKNKLRRIVEKFGHLPIPEINFISAIISSDFEFLAVQEIKEKNGRVIDLSVPKFHSFIGNGFVCHNTQIGLEAIARLKQPALWLTHTRDLAEQAAQRAAQVLGISRKEIGMLGNGQEKIGSRLTIGIIQKMIRMDLTEIAEKFGIVILDEAHHTGGAHTWVDIINQLPAKYRYGVTATFERADGLEIITQRVVGPTLHIIDRSQVEAGGGVVIPKLCTIKTGIESIHWSRYQERAARYKKQGWKPPIIPYGDILAEVLGNMERNQLIVDTLKKECPGHCSLVLSERVNHCEELANWLRSQYPNLRIEVIHGKLNKGKRQEILSAMNTGELDVLFAVDIAKEGLDVPRLNRLFLVAGGRNGAEVEQKVGRIQRSYPGKGEAVVFDFVDEKIGVLYAQYWARYKVYKKLRIRKGQEITFENTSTNCR